MSKDEMIEHLHKQADDIDRTVPLKETPLAFIGAIGVPLVDWVLASMPYEDEANNIPAIRITLETMRGMMIGVAETY